MVFNSKLPHINTNIFTIMSSLANEHQAINLAQGFPNFDPPEALLQLTSDALFLSKNQYAPMAGLIELRTSISEMILAKHSININPNTEICITSGASEALFSAIQALVHDGDEVICIEPCYDLYEPVIRLCKGVYIGIPSEGPNFEIDWNLIESKVSDKTKLIIINSPNNPTGQLITKEDLDKLYHIIKNHNILILSDEVYEHLVFDNKKHFSILAHDKLSERSLVVFSFGKTFHCTGWKIGYAVGPENLLFEFKKVHQFNVFCVPHFIQFALAEFLKNPASYNYLGGFYQEKRDLFQSLMSSSKFKALPSQGSFFQLYDYSEITEENDKDFAKRLTIEAGVAGIPISAFYGDEPKKQYIRFCFAKTVDILEQAAEKLCRI